MFIKISRLAESEISGGLSGAELVAACRDAALIALEEDENLNYDSSGPCIGMHHLVKALTSMERQISDEMLAFYASLQRKAENH
jgi:SpoVK/Ycf46/Vps4 family AAA+-type ATPase